MANVSSSNGLEKRPKLRFPGFDEPWKETNLSTLFSKSTQKNADGHITNVICNSAKLGLIPQREYFDKDIANSDNTSGYYIIRQNDFVYNPRKSSDAPYGPISSYKYAEDGIVSPLYLCFRAKGEINPLYYEWYFRSSAWHRYIYMSGDSGARHDRVSIKDDTFFAMPINLPSEQEQSKIASFLQSLDERIAAQEKLVASLKKYKRGLSNSLFDRLSAESESQLCIFGDMMTILQNNTFSRDNLSVGGNGVRNIHYGDVLIKYGAVLDLHSENVPVINAEQDISKFSALSYLRNGDVVFADTAEDYTVGKSTEIIGAENIAALSGLHTIPCRPQGSFAPMYLGYYFNSDYFKKQLYPMIQGTKVSSISKSEIIKTKIIVPCLQEQARISSIMSALDDRIDAAKHTTKDLIDLRSGLLQQLFI